MDVVRTVCGRAWLLLVVSLAVSGAGCSATEVRPGEAIAPGVDDGIVVFSLMRSGQRDFDLRLDLRGPGDSGLATVSLYARSRARDWRGGPHTATPADDPEGRLVVLRLPPGSYRIDHWWGESPDGGMWGDGYDVHGGKIAVDFSVVPGEARYLGSLHLLLPQAWNYNANLLPAYYRMVVEDRSERDLSRLREQHPGVTGRNVAQALMRFDKAGQPIRYYLFNRKVGGPEADWK